MILDYDPETDILTIELSNRPIAESDEIASGVVADFDEEGHVVGIEITGASRQVDFSKIELNSLPIAALHLTRARPAAE